VNSAVLNICFPYTSREEITSAIKTTVEEYSKPLSANARPFSQTRITQNIRSKKSITSPQSSPSPGTSPAPSNVSDIDDSISTSTTLHPDSPPIGQGEGTVYPDSETITADTIAGHLYTSGDPPLDLLIRTSGVKRLSDFMLWQCHEDTDIVFLNCMWPEFDLWQFLPVLVEWQRKQRSVEEKRVNGLKGRRIKVY
jgi:ditrans,polycis-polyprenyl diphosphate synthase